MPQENWKKEFRKRFKNPKYTGYRVGQEFLAAIEIFIYDLLASQKQGLIGRIKLMKIPPYDVDISYNRAFEKYILEEINKLLEN